VSTGRAWTAGVTGATAHPYLRSAGIGAATDAAFMPDRVDVAITGATVCRGGVIGDPCEGVDPTGRTDHLSIAYVHGNSAYST
jgi:glutamate N-acetyltransferase / amino-acid N-acetyltransferase